MEERILEVVRTEIARQRELENRAIFEKISTLYDIPVERLVKDARGIETPFCKGILKSHERCLKKPKENGYCGFHQKQAPKQAETVRPSVEEPPPPWAT